MKLFQTKNLLLLALMLFAFAQAIAAQTTTFTYQGRLTDASTTANGTYDLGFALFDQATGGAQIGTAQTRAAVTVSNGIFTVQLDFGAAAFPGANRFLEIAVKRPADANFTTLAPRQQVTNTPYAIRAISAQAADTATTATNAAQLGGVAANQFVQTSDARLSDARTPNAGSANYIQNTTAQQTGNFNISGNGTIGGTLTANRAAVNGVFARGGTPGAFGANNNGYAFNGNGGDSDSGLFSEANGQVSLFTNASERVRVTDSGLQVFGTLTANTKNFQIDHPLDPLNKTLTYTSIESPDMMNIYNGNITTDANGDAIVSMPDYFEALNKDFRYQLPVIGTFAQAIVSEEIKGNTFKIKTDKPNVKVSWQITGIRHDKFADDKRPQVEENKSDADKGKCLYEPACQNKLKERK